MLVVSCCSLEEVLERPGISHGLKSLYSMHVVLRRSHLTNTIHVRFWDLILEVEFRWNSANASFLRRLERLCTVSRFLDSLERLSTIAGVEASEIIDIEELGHSFCLSLRLI